MQNAVERIGYRLALGVIIAYIIAVIILMGWGLVRLMLWLYPHFVSGVAK